MAMLSASGRYRRSPRPVVTKEAGIKIEARTKALGPSFDYQRLKKCNSQQALENPDWRTRPSDNTSSSTADNEQSWRNLMGTEKQLLSMDAFKTATYHAGVGKHEAQLQKTSDSPPDQELVSSDTRYHRRNVFALSSQMEPKILRALEEEPVQYRVLKQICLSASKDYPLTLLEVAPLSNSPSFLSPSVVDIRPLKASSMQKKSSNDQDEQLEAALRAAEATPHKVRVHMNQQSRQDDANMAYKNPDELLRRGIFELQGTFTTKSKGAEDRSDENRFPPSQTARLANDERPQVVFGAERGEAFQKLLKKLGQKNRDSLAEKPQRRDRVDRGFEDGSRDEQSGGSTETCILRHRTKRPDGQKQPILETSTSQRARGPDGSRKENANRPGEDSARFRSLNPKAREFLSFVPSRSSSSEECNMEPLQALAAESFASKSAQANAVSLAELGLPSISSLQQQQQQQQQSPPPPYGLVPLATSLDAAADSLTLNSLMAGRLLPVQVGTDQFGSQFLAPSLPMQTTLPTAPFLPEVFRPQTVIQSMTGNNILGIPPAPPLLNTTYPLVASSNPCLSLPSCQMPPMTSASCQPQPVPKPRRPDPGDQQAYEAWIEWRKANEPGYALECRLRQQRRAQRSMTDRAPPKAPPTKKGEASVSA